MKAVLDPAVLITALPSGAGASAEILRIALLQEFTLLMDYKLACEYRKVSLRAEQLHASGKSKEQAGFLLEALESVAVPVFVAFRHRPLSPDATDDRIFDVAINGSADAIVTNNVSHFRKAAVAFDVSVLTPAEFLHQLRKQERM